MIIDGTLKLSAKQNVTTTVVSENTIDRGADAGRLFGERENIAAVLNVGTVKANDEASVTVSIETSADNATWNVVHTGYKVLGSNFVPGAIILEAFPFSAFSADRYVRLKYVVVGSASLVVDAFVCEDATPFVDHDFKTKA